jgi:hypothetical protein
MNIKRMKPYTTTPEGFPELTPTCEPVAVVAPVRKNILPPRVKTATIKKVCPKEAIKFTG